MGQVGSDMSDDDEASNEEVRQRGGTERYNLRQLPPSGNGTEERRRGTSDNRFRYRTILQILASGLGSASDSDDERSTGRREWIGNLLQATGESDSDYTEGMELDQDALRNFGYEGSSRVHAGSITKPSLELMKSLHDSDFSSLTKERLGLDPTSDDQSEPVNNGQQNNSCLPVVELLADREIGGFKKSKFPCFTQGCRCSLMGNFIPNHRQKVVRYSQKLFCGVYSQNGDIFMSSCQDHKIRLFDTSNGQFNRFRTVHAQNVGWSILDTALSPDDRHLVYSSWCDNLYQVSLCGPNGLLRGDDEVGPHVALPLCEDAHRFCVFSMRYSHDGNVILCGVNNGYLYLYDRGANVRSLKINAHADDVNAVSFVDSATHILASGGDDGLCCVWDRRSLREDRPQPVGRFAGHTDGVVYIDSRGDGRHLITNSKDQSIKLWDLRRFSGNDAVQQTRAAVSNQTWDYRWQPRQSKSSAPRRIEGDSSVMTYRGHSVLRTLVRCKFSPAHTTAQRFIYTGSANGEVYIYDALTGKVAQILLGHLACVRDVSWHPFQPELVTSSWDYSFARWGYKEDFEEEEEKEVKEKTVKT